MFKAPHNISELEIHMHGNDHSSDPNVKNICGKRHAANVWKIKAAKN